MGQAGYASLVGRMLGCLIACAVSATAIAQEAATVRLEWSVPEGSGCATEDELRLQVERLSERAPFVPPGATAAYTIAGVIEPHETRWRARIALHDGDGRELGQREVLGRSPTCRTLNVPVALVIVTMADSLITGAPGAAAEQPAAPAPSPLPKPKVSLEPNAPQPEAADSQEPEVLFGLGAFGAVDLTLLPSPSPGIGAAIELQTPLPIAIDATLYAPIDELDAEGRGARLYLWHAGVAVCPALIEGSLGAQLCATGQLGAISAGSQGLTRTGSAERLVAIIGFEPKLVWSISGGLSARASILAGWVLARPSFRMDIEGQAPRILRSDPVSLQLRVGVMGFAL